MESRGYNVGVLNMQTESIDGRTVTVAPANNQGARLQREMGRSNVGAMFVARQGVGRHAAAEDYNRAHGFDLGWQATTNGSLFGVRRPDGFASGARQFRLCGACRLHLRSPVMDGERRLRPGGGAVQPGGGFLRCRGFRQVEGATT